jgi:hypothetical protein
VQSAENSAWNLVAGVYHLSVIVDTKQSVDVIFFSFFFLAVLGIDVIFVSHCKPLFFFPTMTLIIRTL